MKSVIRFILFFVLFNLSNNLFAQNYSMPHENDEHEGTWLQWPHQYEYGVAYRNSLDATWVAMTDALVDHENVHIIAYNSTEQIRITNLLNTAAIPLTNIDFFIHKTNDVWVRDNGPIFVKDASGNLNIEDWGFNGWGGDYDYDFCDPIPTSVGIDISLPVINLNNTMTIEGGSFELDGSGVFMATKTSILTQVNSNGALAIRNPGMTQAQAETLLTQYIGATKFIWLDGFLGTDDITDAHIDGFVKFVDEDIMVTMSNSDLTYWGLSASDRNLIMNASNALNQTYTKTFLPLTQNNVINTSSFNLGYKGSYVNYYVANNVILVPNYNDPNDAVANGIIQNLYPGRVAVGIDVRNLYEYGGMVHCVTQQQPLASVTNEINDFNDFDFELEQNFPNPSDKNTIISFSISDYAHCSIEIYNSIGQLVLTVTDQNLSVGNHSFKVNTEKYSNGIYSYVLKVNNIGVKSKMMIINH
jgi:agmatine deiminase